MSNEQKKQPVCLEVFKGLKYNVLKGLSDRILGTILKQLKQLCKHPWSPQNGSIRGGRCPDLSRLGSCLDQAGTDALLKRPRYAHAYRCLICSTECTSETFVFTVLFSFVCFKRKGSSSNESIFRGLRFREGILLSLCHFGS